MSIVNCQLLIVPESFFARIRCSQQIFNLIESFERRYRVVPVDLLVVKNASKLRRQYSFSFWDSLIVASALEAGVSILYSEDMQNGLVVADALEIVNPFKEN